MTDMNKCDRAAELISYFYDEAPANERRNFEQHLSACGACRDELAAFGEVRGAVREWRADVLSHAPALSLPAFVPDAARNGRPAHAPAALPPPRRSAFAALREFFTLTPAWARFAMVAASLVVCALATLAIINIAQPGRGNTSSDLSKAEAPTVAPDVATADHTQAEMNSLIAERDAAQHELAATRKQLDAAQQQVAVLNASLVNMKAVQRQTMLASLRTPHGRSNAGASAPRPDRTQVAVNGEQDEDGLRLSDLLTEVGAGANVPPGKRN
jgi:hypothetical protein